VSDISPAALDECLGSQSGDDPFLLDIRLASGSIDRSHSVPVYDDLRRGDESALRDRLTDVPTDREVVVVCTMGIVARRATSVLRTEGYDVSTLFCGMHGWMEYQNGSLEYRLRSFLWRLR
jgi:rhodanese-related sulfurtransferase